MKRTRAWFILTPVVLVLTSVPLWAAYPRILMIYGATLEKLLVVDDPFEIVKIFAGPEPLERPAAQRPYFELGLFWGREWNRYMDEKKTARGLKPEDITPFENIPIHGRFYPACADAPAAISLTAVQTGSVQTIWELRAEGLDVLERAGVPVKADCRLELR